MDLSGPPCPVHPLSYRRTRKHRQLGLVHRPVRGRAARSRPSLAPRSPRAGLVPGRPAIGVREIRDPLRGAPGTGSVWVSWSREFRPKVSLQTVLMEGILLGS